MPRYVGYAGAKLKHLIFGGKDYSFDDTENWTITGGLRNLQGYFDKWLDKGGFDQYTGKKTNWGLKAAAKVGNFTGGVLNSGLSLVTGAGMLVFEPHKVIDSLGMMITEWKAFKEALKSVVHYKDFDEGRYGIMAGKLARGYGWLCLL